MTGSQSRESFTPGQTSDSSSNTRGKSRMHQRARTDPSGGRGATRVPTGTQGNAGGRHVAWGPASVLIHISVHTMAFSASSRIFDLNGEVKAAITKHRSQIIPPVSVIP